MQPGERRQQQRTVTDQGRQRAQSKPRHDPAQTVLRRRTVADEAIGEVVKAVVHRDTDEAHAEEQRHDVEVAEPPQAK